MEKKDIVKLLENDHSVINEESTVSRSTTLHIAVQDRRNDIVDVLIEHGADLDKRDQRGKTGLMWAFQKNDVGLIKELISRSDLMILDNKKLNVLHYYATYTDEDIFDEIYEFLEPVFEYLVNQKNERGQTPIQLALFKRKEALVYQFLATGMCDMHATGSRDRTLLHTACNENFEDIVHLLVEKWPEIIDSADEIGNTALHLVARKGYVKIGKFLLDSGADFTLMNNDDKTPLHYSIIYQNEDLSNVITRYGGDISLLYNEDLYAQKKLLSVKKQNDNLDNEESSSSEDEFRFLKSIKKKGMRYSMSTSAVSMIEKKPINKLGFIVDEETDTNLMVPLVKKQKKKYTKMKKKSITQTDKWIKRAQKLEKKLTSKALFKGIPDQFRLETWRQFSSCDELKVQNENIFQENLNSFVSSVTIQQIDMDINRSCRRHFLYSERYGPGQISLFNILKAYSVYDPAVGYCQGMSDITAFLLLYVEEEECFWLLTELLLNRKYDMQGYFLPSFVGLKKGYFVLDLVIQNKLPELDAHLKVFDVIPAYYSTAWFLKIFLDTLDDDLVRKIWDVYMCEGNYIIYSFMYCLLKINAKSLITKDFSEIMSFWGTIGETVGFDFMEYVYQNRLSEKTIRLYELQYEP